MEIISVKWDPASGKFLLTIGETTFALYEGEMEEICNCFEAAEIDRWEEE